MVSIFGKGRAETQPQELVELDWGAREGQEALKLKVMGIECFEDVDAVLDSLREKNNIIVMKIRQSMSTDKTEVRRAIRRVQKTTYAIGGDLIGLSEDLILVAPPTVSIDRSKVRTSVEPPVSEEY